MSNFNHQSPQMPVNLFTLRSVVIDQQNTWLKITLAFFLALLFFLNKSARGQLRIDRPPLSLDSLKQVLPLLHNEAKVDCLNELARAYCEKMTLRDTDSALKKLDRAYKEAFAIKYIKALGDACIQYGMIYTWLLPNYRLCEKYYREAIAWHEKIEYHDGLGFGYRGLGMIFFNQGAIDESMKAFDQSEFHFTRADNKVMLADLVEWFGAIAGAKGDFEKHFELIKKGLQEKRKLNNTRGIVWSLYRLAYLYVGVEDYETALDYLRQSDQQADPNSKPWQIYRSMGRMFLYMGNFDSSAYYFKKVLEINPRDGPALSGLGQLFMRKKEHKKALGYLQKALVTFDENVDLGGKIWALLDIGNTYAEMKEHTMALQYSRKSLHMAIQNNNKPVMQYAYQIIWKVFDQLQQRDSNYYYYRRYVSLKDSLDDARFKRRLFQKLILYKAETKQEQQLARIALLNKDNQIKHQQLQKESLMKKVLTGSLAGLVLLSTIVLRNVFLKRKNEKHRRELAENELQIQKLQSERTKAELLQQKAELEMQALRAQMNPHFIFNSLNSISSFILKNQRTEATEYLTKFSRLVRMILHSSASAAVSLSEDLAALQLYMELESLRFEQKFDFKIECDPDLDPDFIHVPPMLLQPYVENAIWHGLMLKKEKGNLWVNISQEGSNLICTVTDNGIGRKKAAEFKSVSTDEHKSMGMGITADRIALLHQQNQKETSVQITDLIFPDGSSGGTEVVIKIPVVYD